jgi:phosphoribosylaminoimidazole-succinocarboxamide synthase
LLLRAPTPRRRRRRPANAAARLAPGHAAGGQGRATGLPGSILQHNGIRAGHGRGGSVVFPGALRYRRRAAAAGPCRKGPHMDRRMSRRRKVYEGKAKVLFEGPEPGTLIQYFKDDATAFNNQKQGIITGKGVLNNRISEHLMLRLAAIGIPTHFVRRLNMREQLIKEVEIIPLEVVVRNVVAGSLAKRFGMEEGAPLPRSIVEYYYKSDELEDPMVSEEHITAFGWASYQDLDELLNLSLRINDFLTGLFAGVGLRLIDFKLEYGRLWEDEDMRLVLADEISPDSCRLWDVVTNEKLDKDRFRRDLGRVEEGYQEVARRLGILPEAGPRDLKGPEMVQ